MLLHASFLLLLVLITTTAESWFPPERARGGKLWQDFLRRHHFHPNDDGQNEHTWDAPVNHFDARDTSTFKQRYFMDAQYMQQSANNDNNNTSNCTLVFLMIGGEGTLTSAPKGFVQELAKEYDALSVALEHRFYGKSFPNHDMSTESYAKYLTVDQALADLARFSDYLQAEKFPGHTLRFFTIGGSYPGALSAFYRMSYPNKTVGSLSSSGVVHAILSFPEFDKTVAQAIGGSCSDRLRNVTRAFEEALRVPATACVAKGLLGCDCEMWDPDFYYMLADAAAMVVQYSNKSVLCDALLEGMGPDPSPFEMVFGFANFTNHYYGPQFGSSCFYDSRCAGDVKRATLNERSWRWQKCSELAYFQVAPSPEEGSLRSEQVTLEYHLEQCRRIFGDQIGTPSVKAINARFGGATPRATRVFYSDFSDDPWQAASVQEEVDADQPYELAVFDGAGHCSDLHASTPDDHPDLVNLRTRFKTYLTQWLMEDEEEET